MKEVYNLLIQPIQKNIYNEIITLWPQHLWSIPHFNSYWSWKAEQRRQQALWSSNPQHPLSSRRSTLFTRQQSQPPNPCLSKSSHLASGFFLSFFFLGTFRERAERSWAVEIFISLLSIDSSSLNIGVMAYHCRELKSNIPSAITFLRRTAKHPKLFVSRPQRKISSSKSSTILIFMRMIHSSILPIRPSDPNNPSSLLSCLSDIKCWKSLHFLNMSDSEILLIGSKYLPCSSVHSWWPCF